MMKFDYFNTVYYVVCCLYVPFFLGLTDGEGGGGAGRVQVHCVGIKCIYKLYKIKTGQRRMRLFQALFFGFDKKTKEEL